jgi:hypothetical protein
MKKYGLVSLLFLGMNVLACEEGKVNAELARIKEVAESNPAMFVYTEGRQRGGSCSHYPEIARMEAKELKEHVEKLENIIFSKKQQEAQKLEENIVYTEGSMWGSGANYRSWLGRDGAQIIDLNEGYAAQLSKQKVSQQPKSIHIVNGVELDLDDID